MLFFLPYGFFIIGTVLLFVSLYQFLKSRMFLTSGETTDGKVIEMRRIERNNSFYYHTVFEYFDQKDQRHTFQQNIKLNVPLYAKGETVKVVYATDRMNIAKVKSVWGLYSGAMVILSGSLIFMLLGGIMITLISG